MLCVVFVAKYGREAIVDLFGNSKSVIPAKAGIQTAGVVRWIPAYAGMTTGMQE